MSLKYFQPLLQTHDLVMDLKWNHSLREEFHANEAAVLSRYEITDAERAAIESRNFGVLYELGVHPYLLSQLARLIFGTAEGAGTSQAATAIIESLLIRPGLTTDPL